jgi:hypothetical protein
MSQVTMVSFGPRTINTFGSNFILLPVLSMQIQCR